MPTSHVRVMNRLVRFRAPGFHFYSFFEQKAAYKNRVNQVLTGIVTQIIGQGAARTKLGRPVFLVFWTAHSPAFFKVATAIIISVEEFTFATVWNSHQKSHYPKRESSNPQCEYLPGLCHPS